MMATLLPLALAGYLLYILCMMALLIPVALAMFLAFPSLLKLPDSIVAWMILNITVGLKNFLISDSHYTLPSSVPEVIAILVCLAFKQVCMIIGLVVHDKFESAWRATLGKHRDKDRCLPDWIDMIFSSVAIYAVDLFMSSNKVLTDVDHAYNAFGQDGDTASLSSLPPDLWSQQLSNWAWLASMVALSFLVLGIAGVTIRNTSIWWPELIHTSIVGLTLLLLNMMWGSPFEKPSTDSDMKSALIGLAIYVFYIVCSMTVSYGFFGPLLLLKTFTVSLTFVLLNIFVKPSNVSDMIAGLAGLTGMITTTLLALLILLAFSFVVFMFLHTWAEILLPSARRNYPAGTFAGIVCLTFMGMKIVVNIPVDKPSIFSDMRAGLLGITYMINDCHDAYVVITNLTLLVVPIVLSMESRRKISMYKLYITAAFVVALGLVLTMPPGPGMPAENAASTLVEDDFVQQTITSFVTSQIKKMDGEILQLTDS